MNFYMQAAEILTKLLAKESSIKSLTLADNVKEKKKMYALICETLKYKNVINQVIENSQLLKVEKKLPKNIAILLVHDLLFSSNGIKNLSDGPYKAAIMRNEIRLRAELVKLKIKLKIKNNEDLISSGYRNSVALPRYVRVNTLKTSVEKVIEHFQSEGYMLEEPIKNLNNLSPKTIRKDFHLSDLLILPPDTDLHNHILYLSGDIILQDKASCFPSYVCSPSINSYVIDACAAPGNKTSHLSAIMKNSGKIWAFDLDKKRLKLLEKLTQKAGCKNIEAVHGSFLDVDPLDKKYSKVEYILLDPSCSGSGIVNRLDRLLDSSEQKTYQSDSNQKSQERLKNLSEFQVKIILHAFKFPLAKKIVYSTCSIHSQENEQVVKEVLQQNNDFILANRNDVIPTWNRRGISSEFDDNEEADKLIRTLPEDFTNGFFVACFIRKLNYMENATNTINTSNINNSKRQKRKRKRKKHKKVDDNLNENDDVDLEMNVQKKNRYI
ncbi:S-adenosyl-L-methionine-dependent methyltransferase [Glomus cerebriforme]|uniref:S-adenosyl-L-methionine-dependent methyltransferase n=1 Tax=Glomus cerebriforme TaxID=658196 RepID=A0A397TGF8_9GLOM|nr:S-adenosyl-L-methionine-dependent methyltransferase [Glomus cerebriforme]